MEIQDKCFELTNLLSIQPKNEKILNLFNQINSIYDFGKGKKGYLALAAAVFIIIRQDKVPLTIGDVYKHLSQEYGPIHYKELGKMFTNIVSSLKLQLPLADFFSYFEKCMHSLPIIDKPKFISRSQALSEFGILTGLDTGRSKSSVCLAVILLVLEAESGSKPSSDLILSSCDLLSVSKRQVMTRRLEYISRLIEYGRQWPFMHDLDSKNFSVLLGSLIDWGAEREWKGMNSDLSYNPPAYKKSMSNCAETFDRISSVKRAIDQQDTADLNSKDLIIADYLKDGYSKEEANLIFLVEFLPGIYMSTRSERAADKAQNEKNIKNLKELMMRPENRKCVDCRKRDPRWASWNLGVFFCIRCSGIHRSLGVHISKVKSVDLDTWTTDQVQNMVKWGNSKANSYWESQLPSNFEPPEGSIDQWIRAKYERKQFAAPGPMPDPDSITGQKDDMPLRNNDVTQNKPIVAKTSSFQKPQVSAAVKSSASPMDDLFNAFQAPSSSSTQGGDKLIDLKTNILSLYSQSAVPNSQLSTTYSGLATNSTSSGFADFANFDQFKKQSDSSPKNSGIADLDFFSSSDFSKPETSVSPTQQIPVTSNSLLDMDSINFSGNSAQNLPNTPSISQPKPLEIDFASFSISKNEQKATYSAPGIANGFSTDSGISSFSQKMDPGLFNHWQNPEPPKSSPAGEIFTEKYSVESVSTPISCIMDSPTIPDFQSGRDTIISDFQSSPETVGPASKNSALEFVDPWSDFQ